jgi:meiotically up-regulated gene 157 (Mug157) protein
VTDLLGSGANRALVSSTRPSGLGVFTFIAALLLSVTALSDASHTPAPRRITVALPGSPAGGDHIEADILFHTIDSDFFLEDDGTMYVQTGDIPAMWLRDSSAQTLPYVRFTDAVPAFSPIVRAVIERNARNILTAPRANAFTAGFKIWEEKWEPDSLAYPVILVWAYWNQTHDRSIFTRHLQWAMQHTVAVYQCEQHHDPCSDYRSKYLSNGGRGADFADTGMVWGAFRPSDDPVRYPFNVPQNMMAAIALDEIADLATACGDRHLAAGAAQTAYSIRAGIERFGKVYDFRYGWIYAYEVDGLGDFKLMDDANVPDLLSAPLIGYVSPFDPIYQNTRRFVLSGDDPYYYAGRYASGLGSPHTPTGWVWPLGLSTRALTSTDRSETADQLRQIIATTGSDGLMHESFDPDDPSRFTRSEFGWANAVYAELLFRSVAGLPGVVVRPGVLPRILPVDVDTPTISPLIERLINEGTLTQSLRQSVL